MKRIFIALLIMGLTAAFTVNPAYTGVHDSGNENLPALDVGITVDCDSKLAGINVASNDTGEPLQGAVAYLFYTDYSYQALPNPGTTDAQGNTAIPVPGTIRFLNALFILRVDKQGYQSREIEFTYKKCFDAPPKPPEPPPVQNGTNTTNQTANQTQNATQPGNVTVPANDTKPPVPPQTTENGTGQPQPDGHGEPGASACPAGALLAILALSLVLKKG